VSLPETKRDIGSGDIWFGLGDDNPRYIWITQDCKFIIEDREEKDPEKIVEAFKVWMRAYVSDVVL
jgi:hypothetical protein